MVEVLTGTVVGKVLIGVAAANVVATSIAAEWAIPANTLLLILLTLVTRQNGRKIDDTGDKIDANTSHVVETKASVAEAKATTTSAAAAAASAAAAAATAAQTAAQMHDTVTDAVSGALADRRKSDPA